ncbi:hypothetical protein L1987_31922 [Smallanthus sonchifolius]|uniref:Uncharacterized protein n=1 Tax=Smallanthus sonchifolius TaxID=185202 RepID=A0ACB9I6Z2_9ASTR|nr:hypothetical protein L1987_31922 [Smallanthus sonchifolius]
MVVVTMLADCGLAKRRIFNRDDDCRNWNLLLNGYRDGKLLETRICAHKMTKHQFFKGNFKIQSEEDAIRAYGKAAIECNKREVVTRPTVMKETYFLQLILVTFIYHDHFYFPSLTFKDVGVTNGALVGLYVGLTNFAARYLHHWTSKTLLSFKSGHRRRSSLEEAASSVHRMRFPSLCDWSFLANILLPLQGPMLFAVFLLLISLEVIESQFLVKTLPGLSGDLPFTLETGYVGVGESDNVQLFYYFIESEGNPKDDPIMFWFTGGPGCSGLSGILYEIGPFTINYANSTLEKPVLEINPHSWTKVASIVFVDQPAGTGFAYAKTREAYITNDTLSTMHAYSFLKKWLAGHPKFLNNPLYLGADSYMGIVLPMIVQEIYNGNEVGEGRPVNIKGYLLGNPFTDTSGDYNSRIRFAHRIALLSDAIYKSVKKNCNGEYLKIDPNNSLCIHDLQVVDKCIGRIRIAHILEPYCETSNTFKSDLFRRGLGALDKIFMDIQSLPQVQKQWCRDDNYEYSYVWANNRDVREALHVHEEFGDNEWVRCNDSMYFYFDKEAISYTHNVLSTVVYHRRLTHTHCRALIYSGDHDMVVPYLSTLNWIESLNLSLVEDWRPWSVEDQVAGYTMKYSKEDYNLTFATVKGGGHTAPEYKPKECLSMFMRWLDNDTL